MKHAPLVDQLINAFTCLPGVGPRSAQRMAYALLDRGRESGRRLGDALHAAMDGVQHCQRCRNYAEAELSLSAMIRVAMPRWSVSLPPPGMCWRLNSPANTGASTSC